MKIHYAILALSVLFVGCQAPVDHSADDAFKKNSETVMKNLQGFQNENLDYSMYSDNFTLRGTGFNQRDSISLDEMKANDAKGWATYDFKLLTDPLVLLPGVNVETKKPDGSVRYYGTWQVTLPATDSTEARTGTIKLYESFDFDADGKIVYQQNYGDAGSLFDYLHEDQNGDGDGEEDDDM